MMKTIILFLLLTLTSYAQVGSLDFDGSNQKIEIDGVASNLQSDSSFTIAFWAKDSDYEGLGMEIGISTNTDAGQLFQFSAFHSSGGNGVLIYYNGSTIIDQNDGSEADGNFHYFLFVSRSATDHEVYVDGVSVGTSNSSKTMASGLNNAQISGWQGGQLNNSTMSNVRIWDRALSSQEIKQSMYCMNMPVGGLVGQWLLNEENYKDTSGNGNDGTCSTCPSTSTDAPPISWCG